MGYREHRVHLMGYREHRVQLIWGSIEVWGKTSAKVMQTKVGKACAAGTRYQLAELVKADSAAGCTGR